jgi:hypothetical protein
MSEVWNASRSWNNSSLTVRRHGAGRVVTNVPVSANRFNAARARRGLGADQRLDRKIEAILRATESARAEPDSTSPARTSSICAYSFWPPRRPSWWSLAGG